jgi:hypothetical protein
MPQPGDDVTSRIIHFALSGAVADRPDGKLLFTGVTRCPDVGQISGEGEQDFWFTHDLHIVTCPTCLRKTPDSLHYHAIALDGKLVSNLPL